MMLALMNFFRKSRKSKKNLMFFSENKPRKLKIKRPGDETNRKLTKKVNKLKSILRDVKI